MAFGAAGVMAGLAGCGPVGRRAGEGAAQPAAAKQPVTLMWSPWDGEGQAIVDGANRGIELYRKTRPHVSFELVPQQGFNAKIDTMIAANDGPDVFGGNGAGWRNRATLGQFLPLDPYIKRDLKGNWKDEYVPSQLNFFSMKDIGQYSLPMYLGTMALYYNKGWFRSKGVAFPDASWDWDKWTEAMRRLTERPDKYGMALVTLLSLSRVDTNLIRANNGYMVDPNNDTRSLIDQPPALAALNWHHDRTWRDRFSVPFTEVQGGTTAWVTQAFAAGRVAMFVEGSWRLAPMAREIPPGVEWDMAVVPRKLRRSTLATTDGWGIWRGTRKADAAWEFMKWLQGDEWNEIFMGIVGLTPARVSLMDRWAGLVVKAYPQLQGKNLAAFTIPAKEKWADVGGFFRFHQEALDILNPAFQKSVRDGKEAVDSTMKEAARQVNAVQAQLAAAGRK